MLKKFILSAAFFAVFQSPALLFSQNLELRLSGDNYKLFAPAGAELDEGGYKLAILRWQNYFGRLSAPVIIFQSEQQKVNLPKFENEEYMIVQWDGSTPHEVCHAFFEEWAKQYSAKDVYANVEDWLVEATGTLCEPETLQQKRRHGFFASPDSRIPLKKFLTMTIPGSTTLSKVDDNSKIKKKVIKKMSVEDDTSEVLKNKRVLVITAAGKDANYKKVAQFYRQTLVFAQWLAERAKNSRVIGKIGKALAQGGTVEDVLRKNPHLPNSISTLNKEWNEWVRQQLVRQPSDEAKSPFEGG